MEKFYELTYLASPDLDEQELADFSQKISSLITEKGKIVKAEPGKKIGLAYPVQKKRGAFLITIEFQTEAEQAEEINKHLEKESNILRFLLITRVSPEKTKKKATPVERTASVKKEENILLPEL